MPIRRCSDQKRLTLIEFYEEVVNSGYTPEMGKGMLAFIEMINQTFIETQLFGLTSHYHLVLLAEDDYRTDWLITVIFYADQYHFDYGTVKRTAANIEEAKQYLITAMKETGGWFGSKELF